MKARTEKKKKGKPVREGWKGVYSRSWLSKGGRDSKRGKGKGYHLSQKKRKRDYPGEARIGRNQKVAKTKKA